MSSVQSLVTLQGKPNSKDGKNAGTKEQLSSGEVDDFSLFQQPLEGAVPQETDVNNTFHEINQSGKDSDSWSDYLTSFACHVVDQVCQDDPDFQSILSNRMQAAPMIKQQKQTEAELMAAQAALLQKATPAPEDDYSDYSSNASKSDEQVNAEQVAKMAAA